MSALDRALIRAYRQQRGGAASYEPPRHAPPIPPHSQHAAQVDLAGPHYRLDAPHHSTHETAVASATPDEWPTFRVDVGVAGVPVAPNLVLTERAGAEPEAKRELAPAGAPTSAVPAPIGVAIAEPVVSVEKSTAPGPLAERPIAIEPGVQDEPAPVLHVESHTGAVCPQLVVDRVIWPEVCDELHRSLSSAPHAKPLLDLSSYRAVALAGVDSGAGVSMAVLTVARSLVAAGKPTTIVDANFAKPGLASLLSVVASQGWDAALNGKEPLEGVLIESLEDHLVLAPLAGSSRKPAITPNATSLKPIMQALRDSSELMLLDAGSLDSEAGRGTLQALYESAGLDGVFLVCDRRTTTPQDVVSLMHELRVSGINVLGTIENFCASA